MSTKIQARRGLKLDLPELDAGELGLCKFISGKYHITNTLNENDAPFFSPTKKTVNTSSAWFELGDPAKFTLDQCVEVYFKCDVDSEIY